MKYNQSYFDRVIDRVRYPVENMDWTIEESLKMEIRRQEVFNEIRENMTIEDELMVYEAYDSKD